MEDKQIAISYYNIHICNSKVCKDCPGRLSVPKHSQIPNYIGCYYPKIIFVLPVLNLKKKNKTNTYEQVNALCELFKEAYGYDLLETCMITWAVRCPDFEHKDYSIDYCDKILYQILCNNHQKYTVFVGKWLSNMMYSKLAKTFKTIVDINAYLLGYISKDSYLDELKKLQL